MKNADRKSTFFREHEDIDVSQVIVSASNSVKQIIPIVPISVCASRMKDRKDIKSMYPKFIAWDVLPRFMTDITWGAMQFKDNYRAINSFKTSRIVGFDFDNGLQTLAGIIDILQSAELPCHVGTTKSHQVEKGKDNLIADRFRVAILMESETSDKDLYRQQLQQFQRIWTTGSRGWFDLSCVEPSRLFYPCKEIVFSQDGKPLEWVEKKEPKKSPPRRGPPMRDLSKVPNWVMRRVLVGPEDRSRHSICYSSAIILEGEGFELDEIVDFLMSGYLGSDEPVGIGEYDVREAAWYGFNKIRGCTNRNEAIDFASAGGKLVKKSAR